MGLRNLISVEDWRGILAFTFVIGFFIVLIIELLLNRDFEASKLLIVPLATILAFYFGEKTVEATIQRLKT
jgi:ABC-type multidrug transport system permease subunit